MISLVRTSTLIGSIAFSSIRRCVCFSVAERWLVGCLGGLVRVGSGRWRLTAVGHNQTVALTSQFAGKPPLTRRPALGDPRPPPGTQSTYLNRST